MVPCCWGPAGGGRIGAAASQQQRQQLDEAQAQLEEGNAALLQAHSRVLGLLAADSQSPNPAQVGCGLQMAAGLAWKLRLGATRPFYSGQLDAGGWVAFLQRFFGHPAPQR